MFSPILEWFTARRRTLFPETDLGRRGEDAAARFLRRKGYKIVARGDADGPGELDLVAVEGSTVVFVEVKTRRGRERGLPSEAVNQEKQRRLTRAAVAYLKRHGLLEYPARFDVLSVTWPEGRRHPEIEHLVGAFDAVGHDEFYS
jgi:putative endonuclease